MEGAAEEAEGLITQTTEVGDYELVDLNGGGHQGGGGGAGGGGATSPSTLAGSSGEGGGGTVTPPTVPHSPSTPDLLYHHRHSTSHHPLPTVPPDGVGDMFYSGAGGMNMHQYNATSHTSAAATLNRYSSSRDQRRQTNQHQHRNSSGILYNNNFHNQSFTAIDGRHLMMPPAVTNTQQQCRGAAANNANNLNTFANGSILLNNGGYIGSSSSNSCTPPQPHSNPAPALTNGTSSSSTNAFLQQDTFIPSDPTPLPNLNLGTEFNSNSNDDRRDDVTTSGCIVTSGGGGHDAAVDVDVCCQRCMPASLMSKISKLNNGGNGNGLFKTLGEFSLRENLYYGSIFLCMTLIVIVCFVVINKSGAAARLMGGLGGGGGGAGGLSGGTAAAIFDPDQQCESLLDPMNGEVHQTGRYHGDRAIYTCATGWEIVGAEERVCQATGLWSNQEPFCKKRVYCLDPPVVHHSTHNGLSDAVTYPLETVLKYTCYPGYLTVGFAHAKCFLYNETAQWFGPDINCKAIRCGEPEEIQNGDVDRKCQTFGCRISYQCRAGYELEGRKHRYCQADGSWSPRLLPDCVPIQCEVPENPENGRAVFASTSYNSLISYECTYGYMLIGDSVRRCERNKQWTGTQPHCKEINCGSPGILPNGWLEGTRTTLHAVVTFRCQEGMTFEGPSYRTICQADGRWSHPLPRCYAPCIVPHISHGFVSDRASGSSVPHANTIDVRCLSQFQKTHNSTPVCKNGTWSRIPKCIPAKCTELPEAPQNGMVVAPKLDHGMVGKFECRDGYMLKGHNTTQCFFGNWTGMTPWCKEVFCPFPGFVENGKVLLVGAMGLYEYRPYVRKIRNNRQIMFQCDRSYLLVGGPTGATCIDGHWSPPQLPRCQAEGHPKARYSRSLNNTLSNGSGQNILRRHHGSSHSHRHVVRQEQRKRLVSNVIGRQPTPSAGEEEEGKAAIIISQPETEQYGDALSSAADSGGGDYSQAVEEELVTLQRPQGRHPPPPSLLFDFVMGVPPTTTTRDLTEKVEKNQRLVVQQKTSDMFEAEEIAEIEALNFFDGGHHPQLRNDNDDINQGATTTITTTNQMSTTSPDNEASEANRLRSVHYDDDDDEWSSEKPDETASSSSEPDESSTSLPFVIV